MSLGSSSTIEGDCWSEQQSTCREDSNRHQKIGILKGEDGTAARRALDEGLLWASRHTGSNLCASRSLCMCKSAEAETCDSKFQVSCEDVNIRDIKDRIELYKVSYWFARTKHNIP